MKRKSKQDKYWDDFCEAQAAGAGYTGAIIYAGVRRTIREARAKKTRAAKRRKGRKS